MLALVWSLYRGMRADLAQQQSQSEGARISAQPAAGLTWQRRLALMMQAPTEAQVKAFITATVRPALDQVAAELSARGRQSHLVDEENGAVALRSPAEGVRDFVYGVSVASHPQAAFSPMAATRPEFRYEARTYFSSGGRGYDVMGMNRDQLISDILVQFERYLILVHSPDVQLVHAAPEHSTGV
jgi:choline/glycine/proline betaine transport protein